MLSSLYTHVFVAEDIFEPIRRSFWGSSQVAFKIDIVETESYTVPIMPFKVVHQRPCKVGADIGSISAYDDNMHESQ
jgi:hypothetical protein